ncbi:dolichyl-phosphate beta-D-mannosyltransferase [Candidatus Kaiserbacteria bacterium CG10_big_fil_rev_8_21_14_0_10_56_12]|uniref:Dolichyl-phosphate beta-D-mannosyltransferase n=1 Tax=Candidatus Kaiserbacteria bacterium CG10_big_fil_rev_8_21_14_0_10_56_12 TaxID=1974611 RepID=A0A2H0UCM7_9BACT|nr:MAG: dolichyl-phosphate beta-D-mannosyltransferase [Candidatus Kaiserbacteria bacterium CG10_big_fil_rev_8_21_14_0_10_56_12]
MSGHTVVLVPTYNERENVSQLIPEIFHHAPDVQVLVIDDSSPDGTAAAVRELSETYPRVQVLVRQAKEGLGAAYRAGMRHVLADPETARVVTMDADGSHPALYLPALLDASKQHDLVIGSRYVRGGEIENWEPWRFALSKWGNRYARFVTGLPVYDLTAGFMCFDAQLLRRLDFMHAGASGYAFLMELKFRAIRSLQASFYEVPIVFRTRREGESKISGHILREGLQTPWRLRLNRH